MKRIAVLFVTITLILFTAFSSGCGKSPAVTAAPSKYPDFKTDTVGTFNATDPVAVITMKDGAVITLELRPDQAPNTVDSFIYLANNGFYDGVIFHRIMQNFMIQSGDPEGTGQGGPGYEIKGEFSNNGFTQNTLSHKAGVLSTARQGDAQDSSKYFNTAGSQFFICDADSTFLDHKYAAFGAVISGMDAVHNIATLPVTDDNGTVQRNAQGTIADTGIIATIRVDTKGKTYPVPEIVSGKLPY